MKEERLMQSMQVAVGNARNENDKETGASGRRDKLSKDQERSCDKERRIEVETTSMTRDVCLLSDDKSV
jgi:hypothetical protein